jgi:TonB-linked SusC/RagA family outer membrane protein
MFLSGFSLFAQTKKTEEEVLKGKVLDEKGAALIGANVSLKGTTRGTATDINGAFSINFPSAPNQILVVTFLGYQRYEVIIGDTRTFEIRMKRTPGNLDEIVVIGYASVKRRDLTGSVSSINADDLKDIPVNSVAAAITGRLAGVQVTTSEGGPGADAKIVIRGGGSISQDNSPLYIIDGIQVESGLTGLSPQDIQSIDVLKDASATAIYGARGANGVIIITTKSGKDMPTAITLNSFVGVNKSVKQLSVMNPYDYVTYQYERSRGNGSDSVSFASNYGNDYAALARYKNTPAINWQQQVFGRNALMQTNNVSATGGNKTSTFNLSLSKNIEEGVMIDSKLDRNILNFRFDHNVSNKLKIGLNVRVLDQTSYGAGVSAAGSTSFSTLRHTVRYQPLITDPNVGIDDYDPSYYAQTNSGGFGVYLINPVALTHAQYRNNHTTQANIGGTINYQLTDFMSLATTASYSSSNVRNDSFDDYITPNAFGNGNRQPLVLINTPVTQTIDVTNVLNFTNSKFKGKFHKNNSISLLLGEETYDVTLRQITQGYRYFPVGITSDQAIGQLNLGTPRVGYPISLDAKNKTASFFGRANYSYKSKYLATFTLRADGSTKFAPENRWGYFPSGALAWKFYEEPFMKKFRFVSDAKLRFSYGESGNNRIGDFLYTSNFTTTAFPYGLNDQLVSSYTALTLANPRLKWETTVSKNLGLDLGFFANRLQVTLDAYQNDVRDLLINVPIPSSSGYATQLQNVGTTRNRGLEIQLTGRLINAKSFSWSTNFNVSFNRNTVLALSTYQNSYTVSSGWGYSGKLDDYIVKVGSPVGSMYGFVEDGFYNVNDFDYNTTTHIYTLKAGVPTDVSIVGIPQPGSLKLKDLNGDGKVDADHDRQIIGNSTPKFSGGINQTFRYKNFDLSIFANFIYGNSIMNANKVEFTNGFIPYENLLTKMNDRWRTIDANGNVLQGLTTVGGQQVVVGVAPDVLAAANKDAKIWQPIKGTAGAFALTSWGIEDGSFLRINNITMGYTLPDQLLSKFKIKGVRIYGTVNNVAILTKYTGYDPEVNVTGSNPVTQGVDYSAYPRSRTFILGVNVKL